MRKNNEQDTIMMAFMIANPDIARSNDGRGGISKKWTQLHKDLNLVGPPVRNLPTWKKTWKNRIRSIRRLLAKNPTGSGLSASEKKVATICDLYNSKQAVTSSRSIKKGPKSLVKTEPPDEEEFLTDEENENQSENFAGFSSPLPSQQASISGSMPEMLKILQAMNAQQAEHFRNMEAIEQKKLEITKAISESIIKFLKK